MNAKLLSQAVAELCLRPDAQVGETIDKAKKLIKEKYRPVKWSQVSVGAQKIIAKVKGVCLIEVTTASALDTTQRAQISKQFGDNAFTTYKTNKKILGGSIIKKDGRVLDGSFIERLNKIKVNI